VHGDGDGDGDGDGACEGDGDGDGDGADGYCMLTLMVMVMVVMVMVVMVMVMMMMVIVMVMLMLMTGRNANQCTPKTSYVVNAPYAKAKNICVGASSTVYCIAPTVHCPKTRPSSRCWLPAFWCLTENFIATSVVWQQ